MCNSSILIVDGRPYEPMSLHQYISVTRTVSTMHQTIIMDMLTCMWYQIEITEH
jgi:hypothetical protein